MKNFESVSDSAGDGLFDDLFAFFSRPQILSVNQTATRFTRGSTSEVLIELSGWGNLKLRAPEHPDWEVDLKRSLRQLWVSGDDAVVASAPKGAAVQITYVNIWGRSHSFIQIDPLPKELQPVSIHEVGRKHTMTGADWLPCNIDTTRLRSVLHLPRSLAMAGTVRPRIFNFFRALSRLTSSSVPKSIKLIDANAIRPSRPQSNTQDFLANITIPEEC
jgi:hypothetical protein